MSATVTELAPLPDELNNWIIGKTINILVTGKTGVGKSALVNSLMGAKIAPEGCTLDAMTKEVASYTANINGISVIIWDSPGLQDGSDNEELYIADMKTKCGSCDLVLYCTRMTEQRYPTSDDSKAIRALNKHLGQQLWDNTVYVLTFSNEVKPTRADPNKVRTKFEQFKSAIPDTMIEKCGVADTVAKGIPIVPAGYVDEDGGGRDLPPLTRDWLSTLWYTAVLKMKRSAQPAMLVANLDRIDNSSLSRGPRQQIAYGTDLSVLSECSNTSSHWNIDSKITEK